MWRIRRDVVLAASCVVFGRGFLGDVGADASAVAVLPAWGDSARHRFGLSGGCGMLCSDFAVKNGGFLTVFPVRLAATAAKLPAVRQRRLERQ